MKKRKFYITTAIDYTNDVIHIGHSYQKIIADVLARYHRLLGERVFFLTGTDEYGETSAEAAKKVGRDAKSFVDEIAKKDRQEINSLNISYDRFIRTTDPDHAKTVKKFWQKVEANGDIYFGEFKGLYCVGCESYKTRRELKDGRCALHPTRKLKTLSEKNYFFRWSKYTDFLRRYINSHPKFILPQVRRKEMLAFLAQGLSDIPISRAALKWGIPVPGDPSQVVYVWFDALINYITGAPGSFWPADVHFLGKDNVRWHALLWPAMLKSAGYDLPKIVYGHGFLSWEGQKISKSLGNVIRPRELVEKFGTDATRYYFIKHGPLVEDADFSLKKIAEVYNADLANGLGNLVARVAKLCEETDFPRSQNFCLQDFPQEFRILVENFKFNEALGFIWKKISAVDRFIDEKKPWELKGERLKRALEFPVGRIREIAVLLEPFLPETAEKIQKQFAGPEIKSEEPLFPRIQRR